jgi:putative salt-induced outer membrane protein YdiY
MERRAERDDYLLKASYLYGISADQPNVERNEASFRWRHTLSRRTFAQSLTAYSADKIRLLNRRVEQNVGVGYRVFGSDRQTVNVGAGFSGLYLDAEGVKPGMGYLGNLFQDYTFIINERYTLVQDASLQYSPETPGGSVYVAGTKTSLYRSTQDHVVGLHSTLQEKINSRLSLNFRFGYEYDSAIPDPSARGDERITTTLGVNF